MKLLAPDGKRRLADAVDHEGVIQLAKSVPNNKAMAFLDWFTYSDNSKKPSPLLIRRKGTITARYANKKIEPHRICLHTKSEVEELCTLL